MAISRENFTIGNFTRKAEANRPEDHQIIKFLRKNHRNAWTVKDIKKHVPLTEEGIRDFLSKAKKKGLVLHKSPYFIAVVQSSKKVKKQVKKKKKK